MEEISPGPSPEMNPHPRPLIRWPLVAVILFLGLVIESGFLIYQYVESQQSVQAKSEAFNDRLFGMAKSVANRLAEEFRDSDGDLLADPPTDAKDWFDPQTLVISYVAGKDSQKQKDVWESLREKLATQTGLPVEYMVVEKQEEQLRALKEGRLHVAGLNTGAVPLAVNAAGYVPVSVLAKEDGSFGYTMQFIVPAQSPIRKVEDIRGQRVTFLWRDSNSGFKAPVVLLRDFGLEPVTDYDYGFSPSHEDSIRSIFKREIAVAPVASDMIERFLSKNPEIDRNEIQVIYKSETFPPAAWGYANRLKPDLAEKVRGVLLECTFAGTSMEVEFSPSGVTRLAKVDFKDAWALVRRIDDAFGTIHAIEPPSETAQR